MLFRGTGVATITPFTKDGEKVDYASFKSLIDYQISGGVKAIIFVGTTGESPTLDHKEHRKVIDFGVEYVSGRVPVIAGTGSNNTREAVELTKFAEEAGANGVLIVSPYYNKPPQEGLYRHFMEVAASSALPNIVYDIQGRTGVLIEPETRIRMLHGSENIAAFKEASGFDHFAECYAAIEEARKGGMVKQEVKYFSGDDDITHKIIEHGGHGAMSVLANIDPEAVNELIYAAVRRDKKAVDDLVNGSYGEKVRAVMQLERNPIPIKAAAHMMGLIDDGSLRLPLVSLGDVSREKEQQLYGVLMKYGLLNKPT